MFKITVKSNLDAQLRTMLTGVKKQHDFALALSLTRTAKQAASDVQTALPEVLDRPTPFTQKSIGWQSANKRTLTAKVFIRPVAAAYLVPLITGGKVRPKRRALIEPANVAVNQYGNLPRNKVKQLLARKDTFSGTIRGTGGIWQRTAKGPKLLIKFEAQQQKRKQFPFAQLVQRSVDKHFANYFAAAWKQAQATAR